MNSLESNTLGLSKAVQLKTASLKGRCNQIKKLFDSSRGREFLISRSRLYPSTDFGVNFAVLEEYAGFYTGSVKHIGGTRSGPPGVKVSVTGLYVRKHNPEKRVPTQKASVLCTPQAADHQGWKQISSNGNVRSEYSNFPFISEFDPLNCLELPIDQLNPWFFGNSLGLLEQELLQGNKVRSVRGEIDFVHMYVGPEEISKYCKPSPKKLYRHRSYDGEKKLMNEILQL